MANDRRVSVGLDADTGAYNAKMLGAAAVTKAFAKEGGLADDAVRGIGNSADGSGHQIDRLSGRLRIIRDLLLSMGPAAVPLGAVAIPGVVGLGSAAGFLAVGLGSTLLAVHGVSDAFKALNNYALDPTEAHLKKVNQTFGRLGPDAQDFILALRDTLPELAKFRDATAEAFFADGGVTAALQDLEDLLPKIQRITTRTAGAVGTAIADDAQSLASERWEDFFDFLAREAPTAVASLNRSLGSLVHGLAGLWMSFDPLNDDVLGWLENAADKFDQWANEVGQTKSFSEFVDYLEANGPQVGETLGAVADALIQIVEAAAPIGGPVLQILESFANVVSLIADSDIGTPLFAGIAAMAALNRGQQLFTITRDSAFGKRAVASVMNYKNALLEVTTAQDRARNSTSQLAALERDRIARIAKGTAAIAGIGLIVSGAADDLGYGTAATLGLTGAMVGGVPGAVAGGLVGAVLDVKGVLDSSKDSIAQWRTEIKQAAASGDIAQLSQTAEEAMSGFQSFQTDLQNNTFSSKLWRFFDPQDLAQDLSELNGGSTVLSRLADAAEDAQTALWNTNGAVFGLARTMGDMGANNADLWERTLRRAQPAMQALGITVEDLAAAYAKHDGSFEVLAGNIDKYRVASDTVTGRTQAVADAIDALGDHSSTTEEKVTALKAALDALLGPGLNLSAATDAWNASLRHLDDELDKNNKSLVGNNDAADKNRETIRTLVTNMSSLLQAAADNGEGQKKLRDRLMASRDAIMKFGTEAGLSKKELADYLTQLGFTPKLVKTLLKLDGVDKAKQDAKDTKGAIEDIPKNPPATQLRADNHQALGAIHEVIAEQARIDPFIESVIRIRTEHMDVRLEGKRAAGGPVRSGGAYLVGEQGPELFYPSASGTVMTHSRTMATLGAVSKSSSDPGQNGPGSDTVGLLGKILKALTGAGFGPGMTRGFMKDLDEIQRGLAKHHGKWTKELRDQAHELMKTIRDAEKERVRQIRDAFHNFVTDLSNGADDIRSQIRDLRQSLREAGGVWNSAMQKHAGRILELAKRYDAQSAILDTQKDKLDELNNSYDDLISQQSSFMNEVTGHFDNEAFGSGLGGFYKTTALDTQNATMFTQVLQQLQAMGLDGEAFKALAGSGDLKTAIQLLGSGDVGSFENAYNARQNALGTLGTYAGETVYGQAISDVSAAIDNQNSLISQTETTMANLQAAVDRQEQVLRKLAGLPAHVQAGAYQGTKEGVKDAAAGAGQRAAMAGGRRLQ